MNIAKLSVMSTYEMESVLTQEITHNVEKYAEFKKEAEERIATMPVKFDGNWDQFEIDNYYGDGIVRVKWSFFNRTKYLTWDFKNNCKVDLRKKEIKQRIENISTTEVVAETTKENNIEVTEVTEKTEATENNTQETYVSKGYKLAYVSIVAENGINKRTFIIRVADTKIYKDAKSAKSAITRNGWNIQNEDKWLNDNTVEMIRWMPVEVIYNTVTEEEEIVPVEWMFITPVTAKEYTKNMETAEVEKLYIEHGGKVTDQAVLNWDKYRMMEYIIQKEKESQLNDLRLMKNNFWLSNSGTINDNYAHKVFWWSGD